ncbi:hypothetical protein LTR53_013246 [Teratosphaeriaceae sp. CCFEE 6253]|nr:hypothetical protein LTR53_013246 [Teratosphaeriaceae sp. CCFEE 6253]
MSDAAVRPLPTRYHRDGARKGRYGEPTPRPRSSRMGYDFPPTAEDLFMGPADFARSLGGAGASPPVTVVRDTGRTYALQPRVPRPPACVPNHISKQRAIASNMDRETRSQKPQPPPTIIHPSCYNWPSFPGSASTAVRKFTPTFPKIKFPPDYISRKPEPSPSVSKDTSEQQVSRSDGEKKPRPPPTVVHPSCYSRPFVPGSATTLAGITKVTPTFHPTTFPTDYVSRKPPRLPPPAPKAPKQVSGPITAPDVFMGEADFAGSCAGSTGVEGMAVETEMNDRREVFWTRKEEADRKAQEPCARAEELKYWVRQWALSPEKFRVRHRDRACVA